MTTSFLAPDPIQGQFFLPGTNTPGNGVQVFFYANKSANKQTVYKDPLAATPWTNPIVLDSGGNLPAGAEVWFPQGQTFTVKYAPANDQDPPVSPYRTLDDLTGVNDTTLVQSEWTAAPAPSFVSVTTLTFAGDQTAAGKADPGRRMKFTVTAGTVYGYIQGRSFGGGLTNVTTVMDAAQALDAGLSAASYGLLSATNDSVPLLPGTRAIFMDPTDNTKRAGLGLGGLTTGLVRVYTLPDVSDTVVVTSAAQTLTAKTLVDPVLSTSVAGVTGNALAQKASAQIGTSNILLVTPSTQAFHPSAAQAWGKADTGGNLASISYNMLSVTDLNTGEIQFNFVTSFTTTDYTVLYGYQAATSITVQALCAFVNNARPPTVSSASLYLTRSDGATQAKVDPNNWFCTVFGKLT